MRPTVLFVLFLCIAQGRALYPFSTSIPQLTQFFHDLHGEEWYNSTGWLQSSDPCDGKWYGINCTIIDDRSLFPIPIQVANISLEDNSLRGTITTKIPLVVYLNLASNNDISGNITSDSFWENTVYLDLSKNHLQGTIPDLSKFALLRYADLSSNYFDGPIEFSSTTSKLELLDLSNNRLKGVIPSNLGTAVNLQSLMLTNNQLFSTIPSSFCNLVSLQQMILSFNFLFGQIPSCIGDLTNMRDLELRSNNLQGYIPSSIYQLNQLELLRLSNNRFSGNLSSSLSNLTQLQILEMDHNELSGPLPELTPFPYLLNMNFRNNRFSGPLPASFISHPSLRSLILSYNYLSGPLPPFYGSKSLQLLSLDHNNFSSVIPSEYLSDLTSIQVIDISYNNFTGPIPDIFAVAGCLQKVVMSHNSFLNHLPGNMQLYGGLTYLDLSYNLLTGKLDGHIELIPQLEYVDLSYNGLSGRIPPEIGQLTNLKTLKISHNQFEGYIPSSVASLTLLTSLDISNNNFFGNLSMTLGQLSLLTSFDISNNLLQFDDLKVITSWTSLQYCNLSYNHMSGRIPQNIDDLTRLISLSVAGNRLTGEIPMSFYQARALQTIDLSDNDFSGVFHPLSSAPTFLNISNNDFSGNTVFVSTLTTVHTLDISHNRFNGSIQIGDLARLETIDMSHNQLSGWLLPPNSPILESIDVSSNHFNGSVPSFIQCPKLTRVDLHDNAFTDGSVARMPSLTYCDMSMNEFVCPLSSPLRDRCGATCQTNDTMDAEVFVRMRIEGNLAEFDKNNFLSTVANVTESSIDRFEIMALSSGSVIIDMAIKPADPNNIDQLQQGTSQRLLYRLTNTPPPVWSDHSIQLLDFSDVPPQIASRSIGGGSIAGIVIGVSCVIVLIVSAVVYYQYRKRKERIREDIELQNHIGRLMLDGVTIEEKIGAGNFGEVWRGKLDDGTVVALKGLKRQDEDTKWMDEIILVQKLNHPNIVRMFGVSQRDDILYMVLEYVENGSLLSFMVRPDKADVLTVDKLMEMVLDVVKGMMYLGKKGIIHRDLAARNLLIDAGYNVKISDFGMSREVDMYQLKSKMLPYRWTAPEVLKQQAATAQSDVWSFGVVCWEIFTKGTLPFSHMSNKEVIENTLKGGKLDQPPLAPQKLFDIMKDCWEMEPEDRPTFRTIRQRLIDSFPHLEDDKRGSVMFEEGENVGGGYQHTKSSGGTQPLYVFADQHGAEGQSDAKQMMEDDDYHTSAKEIAYQNE